MSTTVLSSIASLQRWFAPCGASATQAPIRVVERAPAKNPEKVEGLDTKVRTNEMMYSGKEVHIDRLTAVPLELYWGLVSAAERAKRRGQHELKAPPRRKDGRPNTERPRLVRAAGGA